jgi:hypothetical protein
MKLVDVKNCNKYYNYETIKKGILAKSFIWEEEESIEIQPLIDFLKSKSQRGYIYLITTKECRYPLGTKDKYLKLWKYIFKKYNLLPKKHVEIEIASNTAHIYMGIAEIDMQQFGIAVKIMFESSFSSYLIFSEKELNLEDSLTLYQEVCFRKQKNCFEFEKIINLLSQTQDMMHVINGYNGVSLNYYYNGGIKNTTIAP